MTTQYIHSKRQLQKIEYYLCKIKELLNDQGRDLEYNYFAYDENYYKIYINTDEEHKLTLDGEYYMIESCLKALIYTEPNRL